MDYRVWLLSFSCLVKRHLLVADIAVLAEIVDYYEYFE